MTPSRAVVVMGKLPRPGRVKTRMCPPLEPVQSARLYEAFLLDVFQLVDSVSCVSRVFHCAVLEDGELDEAKRLAPAGWRVVVQRGDGLGERIEHARASGAADHVVVMGSDAPTMASDRIPKAFDALESGADAVFGPTDDGGYDLVGFTGPSPELLANIPWSTDGVMAATRRAAADTALRIVELDLGYDVDHADLLERALVDAQRLNRTHTTVAIEAVLASARPQD